MPSERNIQIRLGSDLFNLHFIQFYEFLFDFGSDLRHIEARI